MALKPEERRSLNQFPVSNRNSWRQEEVKISGNALKTITFTDTAPNMFFIQNPTDTVIHVGISHIPNSRNYEFRVPANSTITFGRPTATNQLYLLNKSNTEVTISLFSVYGDFDMSILQTLNVDLSSTPVFDGIINGYGTGVSLPTGHNHIGTVAVDGNITTVASQEEKTNFQKIKEALENLIGGANITGKFVVKDIIDKLTETNKNTADAKSAVDSVKSAVDSVKSAVDIAKTAIDTVNQNVLKRDTTKNIGFYQQESVSDSTTITFENEPCNPNFINFITNDGEKDINVTFYFTESNSKVVVLKKGDSITDLPISLYGMMIAPKTSGDSISWRLMVSEKGV